MQGVFTAEGTRFKFKANLKAAVGDPDYGQHVWLEATSVFGNEYDGELGSAPAGEYYVVGPDPYTARNWYATITITEDRKVRVS